ncbi:unnamed protein product [Durusdinium trenchii]|uniref:Ankyrin repeat-containing protein n=1 Tax=Durusdinium trenchii TaxID=1381693 RepID=A0ABP0J149_9DINO
MGSAGSLAKEAHEATEPRTTDPPVALPGTSFHRALLSLLCIFRLVKALTLARSADPLTQTGVVAAGEDEDGVDEALAKDRELAEQEKLFLKCLRKRAERETKRKQEKEEKRAAAKKLKEQALEAAFDNELDLLLKLFDQGPSVEPECADEHGTTLLSEACAGNAKEVVEMLLGEACDPNAIGRYHRSPLWRAAYAGNHELIRMLLRSGGDPRECDEQGARPIDVASNAESREFLVTWDPSSTDRIKEDKRKAAKNAEKEEKAKFQRQQQELSDSLEEAERKRQVSRRSVCAQSATETGTHARSVGSELVRARKLLADYRQQKVSFAEQGAAEKIAELEPLIEGAEASVKLFEASVQEWEWKSSRARLKMSDLEQAKKEKEAKAAGKFRGFRVQVSCESLEDLDFLLPRLNKSLEAVEDFSWKDVDLVSGDSLIREGAFKHLKASEFNKNFLETYGRLPAEPEETEEGAENEEPPFPITLGFARGFNRVIPIKAIADVLLKDVGGLRAQDGRWPFVVDPSGRTSTFIKYTGAAVYTIVELQDMESMRLRRALLNSMLNGGAILIDLGSFDMKIEVVAEKFNDLEKGLFAKLLDRSVLYSYLFPRRFKTLITKESRLHELAKDFQISNLLDTFWGRFVFGFVTSFSDPDLEFAKQLLG